ncbi:MAG: bifunctional 4-hydroxy-2-oxoglutarate aldolase/2-dehydro-3-deoxy-phosphogluconate aldolase [Arenimonas sp.]
MDLAGTQARALELLRAARILPIVTVDSLAQARSIARALQAGGLDTIELTLRTPVALDAIAMLKAEMPGLIVGAGTVLEPIHVERARAAGADFLVTPGTPPALADALAAAPIPSIPGAATPTELIALATRGFRVAKLFPAMAVGGLAMVRALQGPLPDLSLCPTGGIAEADAAAFLAEANVACIGGSWMVAKAWIETGNYAAVTASAIRARGLIASTR